MFEEKKDSNLVCFQFVLENIFITFPGKRKTFPTLDLVMKVHSCASSRKKKSFILMQINLSLTLVMSGVLNLLCLYCHFDSVILK